jgi:hypothetical protein
LQFKQKPPKYPTLEYVYKIEEFYNIDRTAEPGTIGTVKFATNISNVSKGTATKHVIKEVEMSRMDKEQLPD